MPDADTKRPALNSPCVCGSGKRYRQCCGKKWTQKKPTKPHELLIALRHVSTKPEELDPKGNELYKTLRDLKIDDPVKFLDRLQAAEAAHKRALVMWRSQKTRAGHNGKRSHKGPGPEPAPAESKPDLGEAKALELLERLLREKPWETFKE
jgi:hypothetical protein